MNGKKAKTIRKKIHGDYNIRETLYTMDNGGTLRCAGRRKQYKKAKKGDKNEI